MAEETVQKGIRMEKTLEKRMMDEIRELNSIVGYDRYDITEFIKEAIVEKIDRRKK